MGTEKPPGSGVQSWASLAEKEDVGVPDSTAFNSYTRSSCGLTQQAAKHHKAIHSLPPSGMGEKNWKVKLMGWDKDP